MSGAGGRACCCSGVRQLQRAAAAHQAGQAARRRRAASAPSAIATHRVRLIQWSVTALATHTPAAAPSDPPSPCQAAALSPPAAGCDWLSRCCALSMAAKVREVVVAHIANLRVAVDDAQEERNEDEAPRAAQVEAMDAEVARQEPEQVGDAVCRAAVAAGSSIAARPETPRSAETAAALTSRASAGGQNLGWAWAHAARVGTIAGATWAPAATAGRRGRRPAAEWVWIKRRSSGPCTCQG